MGRFSMLLIVACSFSAFSLDFPEIDASSGQQLRITKFENMKIGGMTLSIFGVIGTVAGISMIASSGTASYEVTYHPNGTKTESGDPVGGFGAVLTMVGIPMTAGGIVIAVIGSKKEKNARNELRKLQQSIQLKVGSNRMVLVYSF